MVQKKPYSAGEQIVHWDIQNLRCFGYQKSYFALQQRVFYHVINNNCKGPVVFNIISAPFLFHLSTELSFCGRNEEMKCSNNLTLAIKQFILELANHVIQEELLKEIY